MASARTQPIELDKFMDEFIYNHTRVVQSDYMTLLMSPLERIKIIYQTQDILRPARREKSDMFEHGILTSLGRLWDQQSFQSLWSGCFAKVLKIMFQKYFRNLFVFGDPNSESIVQRTTSKIMSSLLALTVTYPLDLIRVRMAAVTSPLPEFQGFLECWSSLSQKGFGELYWGFGAAALSIVTFRISHNITLWLQNRQRPRHTQIKTSYISIFVGMVFSFPYQTVRNRLIMQAGRDHREYTDVFDCIQKVIQENSGFFTLYQGFSVEIKTLFVQFLTLLIVAGISISTLLSYVGHDVRHRLLEQVVEQVENKIKYGQGSRPPAANGHFNNLRDSSI